MRIYLNHNRKAIAALPCEQPYCRLNFRLGYPTSAVTRQPPWQHFFFSYHTQRQISAG